MLSPDKIRELTLVQPSGHNRPAYLSAASGLVCVHAWIYVVADDEHHLGIFREGTSAPGSLWRLVDGDLPDDHKRRKKEKSDFEVLLKLPPFGKYASGAVLAAGSGSKENRRAAVVVGLDDAGVLQDGPAKVDLSFIYGPLEVEFAALNIEGAVTLGSELLLFQRGNKKNCVNAVLRYPLSGFLEALSAARPAPLHPLSIQTYDLGRIGKTPFTFTDAATLADGSVVFSAVAEDTDDTYNDGSCLGAAIGLIDPDGTLRWQRPLSETHKIEGLDARREGEEVKVLMVTDADDITQPAKLLALTMPRDSHK